MKNTLMITALLLVVIAGGAQKQWKVISQQLLFSDPPFKECHASTLIETEPGKMLVAYFAGTGEGNKDVCIWTSYGEKGKWDQPKLVADGIINDTLRYPCWNPVLFKNSPQQLTLYYKVGPSPRQWWGMVKTSQDNGLTWSEATRLPGNILGPIKNKPIRLNDGTILSPSSTETNGNWKVHIERSVDKGNTWQYIPVDTSTGMQVIQPTLLTYGNNKIKLLCRSKSDRVVQSISTDKGLTWSKLTKTNLPNPNSGIDAVSVGNDVQLLVYNPTTNSKQYINDRCKLNVAQSVNGITWNDVAILENGDTQEYSYPAIIVTGDGLVHITYTFDRKNIKHVVLQRQ